MFRLRGCLAAAAAARPLTAPAVADMRVLSSRVPVTLSGSWGRAYAAPAKQREAPVYEEYEGGDDEVASAMPRKEGVPRLMRSKADRASTCFTLFFTYTYSI